MLADLRKKIDVVDKDILALVLKRLELVDQVAEVKRANKIPVFVPGREDEILDDDYLLQLHQYLQEMKKQRKEAEQDADLLNGRLRVLKDEEQKTLKKIEVTRRKTENKMNQLQAQEEELKRKMEFRNRKQQELERLRAQNKKAKENNRMAILMKAEERRRQMEEDIRNLRETKKIMKN